MKPSASYSKLGSRPVAGAGSSRREVLPALAAESPPAPEIAVPDLENEATAGEVVHRAIAASVARLIRYDPIARLGEDPAGVHQARVATRRLRSDLRTFRSLVDDAWSISLRTELGWLAGILGGVRDGDVLLERLRNRTSELHESERVGAAEVIATLQDDRDAAHTSMLWTFRSRRYQELLDTLVAGAEAPRLNQTADARATKIVPELVRRPWRRLARAAGALGECPPDEELHEVRVRAKRVRYAAEAASSIVGAPAKEFARAAARVQNCLGELNDAVVAERWLEEWTRQWRPFDAAQAAETLAALERSAAERARKSWRAPWEELSSPKLREWM